MSTDTQALGHTHTHTHTHTRTREGRGRGVYTPRCQGGFWVKTFE